MEPIVFFTINDFQKEGGGTIRMLGIINELAKVHDNITLISNILDKTKISSNVNHVEIGQIFTPDDKRKFQFLLGISNYKLLNRQFFDFNKRLNEIFEPYHSIEKIIFFEYLDNSIGYWLKKNGIIKHAINDIHGIASNEFYFQYKSANSLKIKFGFYIKNIISKRLDKKVFSKVDGIIYASQAMIDYFTHLYPILKEKKNYYLPYVLGKQNVGVVNHEIVQKFKEELKIQKSDFVFLFAGGFKETGGIQDLISAFDVVCSKYQNAKLVLVGDGPTFNNCQELINTKVNKDKIYLLGRQPYDYLPSFQEIAHVLVCPDRQNLFSDLIVHVKYLDCLISGKLVINGKFKSVLELNKQKELSLLFKPSDIYDLVLNMDESIMNYNSLLIQYKDSKEYTLKELTYSKFIHNLIS
jgi:glycosyltransferase involved in cell wall biosynthesis